MFIANKPVFYSHVLNMVYIYSWYNNVDNLNARTAGLPLTL